VVRVASSTIDFPVHVLDDSSSSSPNLFQFFRHKSNLYSSCSLSSFPFWDRNDICNRSSRVDGRGIIVYEYVRSNIGAVDIGLGWDGCQSDGLRKTWRCGRRVWKIAFVGLRILELSGSKSYYNTGITSMLNSIHMHTNCAYTQSTGPWDHSDPVRSAITLLT
jgi:hypothetical protein